MSAAEWIDTYVPGGMGSDFAAVCVAALLDEFGGPVEEQSALNLVYLLGQDDSRGDGAQPRARPQLAGANEKWHVHGGNDKLISGLLARLPAGSVHLGQQLVALAASGGGFGCTFQSGATTSEVTADHVVLALPFTTLRRVDLGGVPISALHLRAIREEPLGTNSKFSPSSTAGLECRAPLRERVLRRRRPGGDGTPPSTSRDRRGSWLLCPVGPTANGGVPATG